MGTEPLSEPVRVLTEYSQKRVGANEVMRALASHKGWLAPALMFARAEGQDLFLDSMVLFGTETRLPPGELWVFTDRAAAERAQASGALLGPYAADVAGTELFDKIDPGFQIVRVNPYSPSEQGWQFLPGSYELARLWAQVITLEEGFQNRGDSFYEAIARFPAFLLFNGPSGYVITLPNQGGMKNPAVVFTAPDCADAFLARLTDEQRQGLERVAADGMTLIKKLPLQQIDGMLLNAFGPGPANVLFFAEIEDVNSLYDESY
ncbi:MAG TPA: hypothetical protein VJ866_03595 [Pyrinomonadaceae bacterium]|nr:hypothetical protein [Pyrinomonadaceae bacterium]